MELFYFVTFIEYAKVSFGRGGKKNERMRRILTYTNERVTSHQTNGSQKFPCWNLRMQRLHIYAGRKSEEDEREGRDSNRVRLRAHSTRRTKTKPACDSLTHLYHFFLFGVFCVLYCEPKSYPCCTHWWIYPFVRSERAPRAHGSSLSLSSSPSCMAKKNDKCIVISENDEISMDLRHLTIPWNKCANASQQRADKHKEKQRQQMNDGVKGSENTATSERREILALTLVHSQCSLCLWRKVSREIQTLFK